jgi:hypothetical protein
MLKPEKDTPFWVDLFMVLLKWKRVQGFQDSRIQGAKGSRKKKDFKMVFT